MFICLKSVPSWRDIDPPPPPHQTGNVSWTTVERFNYLAIETAAYKVPCSNSSIVLAISTRNIGGKLNPPLFVCCVRSDILSSSIV